MEKISYLKKINNVSVVQQVIDNLTEAMLNRQLRPGDKIPTEAELAESMGVGRNSIREAVKILVYLACWRFAVQKEPSYAMDFQRV